MSREEARRCLTPPTVAKHHVANKKWAATAWNCEGKQQLAGVSYSFSTTSEEMCDFAKTI